MPPRPAIVLDFLARNAGFLKAARENEAALRRQGRSFRAQGRAVARFTTLYQAAAAAAALVAVSTVASSREILRSARELQTFSQATSVSVQDLQLLENAGARVGLVFDDVADVLQTFTESVGLARRGLVAGTGGAQFDALRFLGFSPEEIFNAEDDISSFLDSFFARLRQRTRAEQQELIGEFSLPDAARRLLALPDSPLRAGETLNIGLTAGEDVATLNRVFERMAQTGLQFQRSFRGLLARNEGEISAFLDAIERNTPLILNSGAALANAVGRAGQLVLAGVAQIERRLGTGQDAQTGQARLTGLDFIDVAAILVLVRTFRTQIGVALRVLASGLGSALVVVGSGVAASLAAVFAGVPIAITAALGTALAFGLDGALLGGSIRKTLVGFFDRLVQRLGNLFESVPEEAFQDQGPQAPFVDQGPPIPLVSPTQTQSAILVARITERIRMIEDALNVLIAQRQTDQAQGPEADRLRSLLRSEALEQLQARTREQSRALAQAIDPAFVSEAGAQFLLGLRQQIADLDAQITQAGDPQVQRLQNELERKGQQLRGLAADALPFDFAAFAQDKRRTLDGQVEELEALLRLSGDPAVARSQRRALEAQLAELNALAVARPVDFAAVAQSQRQALEAQIEALEEQIVQASGSQLSDLEAQLIRKSSLLAAARPVDFAAIAQSQRQALEAQLAELDVQEGVRQARRRLSQLNLAKEGAALSRQLDDFAGLADTRQQNERLRLQLSTQANREAARSARALAVERRAAERAQGFLQNLELEARVRSFNLAPEQTLRRYGRFLGDLLSNLEAAEELSTFAERAPQRRQQRDTQSRLALLQRLEQGQFSVNDLATSYYDASITALTDMLTAANSLADIARNLVRQLLSLSTRAAVESLVGPVLQGVFAAGAGGAGGGPSIQLGDLPAQFGPQLGGPQLAAGKAVAPTAALTLTVPIDARGSDAASVDAAIARALPAISHVVEQGQLAALNASPERRDQLRRTLGV